jgi:hypothetical protein
MDLEFKHMKIKVDMKVNLKIIKDMALVKSID